MVNPIVAQEDLRNLSRLKNLKLLGGRRRISPSDPLIEEDVMPDVANTSQNLPMPSDEGGLAPESYDVRANQVIAPPIAQEAPAMPEQEEGKGFWYNFGKVLGRLGSGRNELQEDEHIESAAPAQEIGMDEMAETPVFGENAKNYMMQNVPAPEDMPQDAMQPEVAAPVANVAADEQESDAEQAVNAMNEENREIGTYAEPGTAATVYSNDKMAKAIDEMFGVQITPEVKKELNDMELAIQGYIDEIEGYKTRLTEHQNKLKEQIKNRELTGKDKILMTLALLAPAVVAGAIGGPEAFLGGLGGGAKGLADVLQRREDQGEKDENRLSELALDTARAEKEKVSAQRESAEFKKKVMDSMPNSKLRQEFMRNGVLINGKLALDTGNELLPLKASAVKSEKDIENFKEKKLPKLEEQISGTKEALRLIDQLNRLIDYGKAAADNKNSLQEFGSMFPGYDTVARGIKGSVPATRDTVMDENGNEVKIADLYETYRTQLSDAYRKVAGGAQAFKAYENHFFQQLPNPFSAKAFVAGSSSLDLNRKQLDAVKDKFQSTMSTVAEEQGVDTAPMKELFKSTERNTQISEDKRKRDRANAAVEQVTKGK